MAITVKSYSTSGLSAAKFSLFLMCASTLLFQGCTVGPDYSKPELVMPDQWHQRITEGLAEGEGVAQKWWEGFDDAILTGLIDRATESNLDVRQAALRIQQARASYNIATGENYPEVNMFAGYSRDRFSKNGLQAPVKGYNPDQSNLHFLGFDSSWEIDIFGRINRSVESANASFEATVEDYHDVLVSLYAEIAINYTELRSVQSRISYALENIKIQRDTLTLTENRFDAELVPKLDVTQAKLNLANTESFVPALQILEGQTINRLAVLLGQYPGTLFEELKKPAQIPAQTQIVVVELPIELLRQRPDIRRTERQLAAQVANIGVATADMYPSFSLSGTFALEATNIRELGNMSSRTWGFGPAMRWNIFAGNRIRQNVKLRELIADDFYVQYEKNVLNAFEEVENAIISYQKEKEKRDAIKRAVDASVKSVSLVDSLYRSGLTDFQNVLDMQRTLSDQQDRLAESEGTVIKNLISIYKAFGGGWAGEINEETQEQNSNI